MNRRNVLVLVGVVGLNLVARMVGTPVGMTIGVIAAIVVVVIWRVIEARHIA
jgi:hypothetical protein